LIPLSDLREGEEGIIHSLTGGRQLSSRLAGLGIALNMRIKILRSSGDLMIVQAADTRLRLAAGSGKIFVYRTESLQCGAGEEKQETRQLLVALAGQPMWANPTVFNILTGLSQHVGNCRERLLKRRKAPTSATTW